MVRILTLYPDPRVIRVSWTTKDLRILYVRSWTRSVYGEESKNICVSYPKYKKKKENNDINNLYFYSISVVLWGLELGTYRRS